jgi:hypothetical protein
MVQERERIHGPEKLSLTFSGKALDILTEIAESEGLSLDEVIESALGLKQWALEVKEKGDEVVVRHGNKDKYKLVV